MESEAKQPKKRHYSRITAKSTQITARLPHKLHERLFGHCERTGARITDVVQIALNEYLSKRGI